jgi:hypothetical protein
MFEVERITSWDFWTIVGDFPNIGLIGDGQINHLRFVFAAPRVNWPVPMLWSGKWYDIYLDS